MFLKKCSFIIFFKCLNIFHLFGDANIFPMLISACCLKILPVFLGSMDCELSSLTSRYDFKETTYEEEFPNYEGFQTAR